MNLLARIIIQSVRPFDPRSPKYNNEQSLSSLKLLMPRMGAAELIPSRTYLGAGH